MVTSHGNEPVNVEGTLRTLSAENAALRARLRCHERVGFGLLACVALVFGGAALADGGVAETIKAKRIEIVDVNGIVRTVLGEIPIHPKEQAVFGGNGLGLFDSDGNQRARLSIGAAGTVSVDGLRVFDKAGKYAATIDAVDNGAGFTVREDGGLPAIDITHSRLSTWMALTSKDEKRGVGLGLRTANKGGTVEVVGSAAEPGSIEVRDDLGTVKFKVP